MTARIFIVCVCFVFVAFVSSAQSKKKPEKKANPALDWQLRAFDTDKVYGSVESV